MGIHRKQYQKLALRIFFVLFLLFVGLLIPWWSVFLIGTVLILSNIASVELIAVGIFLDFFLLDIESGFFGLFYTLYFFVIVLAFNIFNSMHSNHES